LPCAWANRTSAQTVHWAGRKARGTGLHYRTPAQPCQGRTLRIGAHNEQQTTSWALARWDFTARLLPQPRRLQSFGEQFDHTALLHPSLRPEGFRSRPRPRLSRYVPVHARYPADDVSRAAVDDAPVRGVRYGCRVEPPVPVPAVAGRQRAERRLRPPDPDRVRLGPSA